MWLIYFVLSLRISHYWMNYETDFSQPANLFKLLKRTQNHLTETKHLSYRRFSGVVTIHTDWRILKTEPRLEHLFVKESTHVPAKAAELNVSYSKHHIYLGLFIFSLHSDWVPFLCFMLQVLNRISVRCWFTLRDSKKKRKLGVFFHQKGFVVCNGRGLKAHTTFVNCSFDAHVGVWRPEITPTLLLSRRRNQHCGSCLCWN